MICAGLVVAWIVYRYVGLRMLTRGWLNLDVVWSAGLVIAGGGQRRHRLVGRGLTESGNAD
jgi:hypothetical protein